MANTLQGANIRTSMALHFSGQRSMSPSQQTGTSPDQFSVVVQRARTILSKSQSGLLPKAATNTAGNTNVAHMEKTIGDLADLVEITFDPKWKEIYRVALVRVLAATEKAKGGATDTVMTKTSIDSAGHTPDTFSHPAIGAVPGMDVSSFSAIQAGYQQRFNPPAPAVPFYGLPIDPVAGGNQYNQKDIPGQATTAIPTRTNPTGSFVQVRGSKPLGQSF